MRSFARSHARPLVFGLVSACVWALATVALADAVVVVHLNTSQAGVTITLTDGAGASHTCSTDATGSCEIAGVAAGRATVTAQSGGPPSASRPVMVPPDGKVSLIVPTP